MGLMISCWSGFGTGRSCVKLKCYGTNQQLQPVSADLLHLPIRYQSEGSTLSKYLLSWTQSIHHGLQYIFHQSCIIIQLHFDG
jgi:hypothetical protein